MQATIRTLTRAADGACTWTDAPGTVPARDAPMFHHRLGLTYTASGYGSRIPMPYMVQLGGRWRRVYCRQYSNAGTCYVGRMRPTGPTLIVDDIDTPEAAR